MIKKAGTTPVTHFTVIKNTKEGIKEQLDQYLAEGVDHMLALRGDIPLGETTTCGDFNIEDEDMAIMDTLNEDLHTSHVPDDLKDVIF